MRLVDILDPSRVVFRLEATDKAGVLEELVTRGFLASDTENDLEPHDTDAIVAVFEDRERLGTTGIGEGVAIPHGKLPGLDHIQACFAISEAGVDYGALDEQPSKFFVALLAPEATAGLHLKALARISRLFRDASFRRRLLECDSAEALYDAIAHEDARY